MLHDTTKHIYTYMPAKITPQHNSKLSGVSSVFSCVPVRAKDTINQLKEEISNLSKLVEKGAGLSVGQENMVKELIRVRDELTRKTGEQGQTIAVRAVCGPHTGNRQKRGVSTQKKKKGC